jgi:hypothetical protein
VEAQKYFEDLNNTKQCPSWVGHSYLPYREETNDIDYTDNKSKFSSNKIIKYMHTNNHTCKLYLIPIRIPMILKNVEISKMLFLFHVMQVLLSVLFSRKEEDLMLYRIDQWPNHNHTYMGIILYIYSSFWSNKNNSNSTCNECKPSVSSLSDKKSAEFFVSSSSLNWSSTSYTHKHKLLNLHPSIDEDKSSIFYIWLLVD